MKFLSVSTTLHRAKSHKAAITSYKHGDDANVGLLTSGDLNLWESYPKGLLNYRLQLSALLFLSAQRKKDKCHEFFTELATFLTQSPLPPLCRPSEIRKKIP